MVWQVKNVYILRDVHEVVFNWLRIAQYKGEFPYDCSRRARGAKGSLITWMKPDGKSIYDSIENAEVSRMASPDHVGRVRELPQVSNPLIRLATEVDVPTMYSIHTSSIRECCSTHYTSEEIADWIERQSPHKYMPFVQQQSVYVAEELGEVVGFAQLGPGEDGRSGEVKALYVSPSAMRRGVGSLLLSFLEQQALSRGWTVLVVNSTMNAVDFYTSQGFAAVGNAQHTVGNQSLSCVHLRKKLLVHS